jgi:ankyrin repeat protein
MPRKITASTSLENLKKEAKRWLKALGANNHEAQERLERAYPGASRNPSLREVQHALAREYGYESWIALKQAISNQSSARAVPKDDPARLIARFLDFACPDHHVRGRPAHRMAQHAAMRILQAHPEIARANLYTAVVCGELEAVERILKERPQMAREKSSATAADRAAVGGAEDIFKDIGPKGWEPLLYLCFTRLPLAKPNDNAVTIARLLLDHGADPNAYFMAGSSRYTPLVGAIGEGEENRPPHPQRDALTRLLLERGAQPYDGQVIYNINFHGQILWYVKLMYEFAVKAGRQADWEDPEWHMLDQGPYGSGARWHLGTAIKNNDFELAEWSLAHGANPNAAPPQDKRFSQRSLYEEAVRLAHTEMAELLVRHGAKRSTTALEDEDVFLSACFQLDRVAAHAQLEAHPEYLRSPLAMHTAAELDRADVVDLLLELGISPDVEDDKRGNPRPLHIAAYNGSVQVAALLIKRGAKIDPVDSMHDATPLWFAMWAQQTEVIKLLSPYSRDVWALNFIGNVARVREVLRTEPQIATMSGESTPLFWLPEDEQKAVELVELFLSYGADPKFRRKEDGLTAADVARRRGLEEAAQKLEVAGDGGESGDTGKPGSPEISKYERVANDMVLAHDSRDEAALRRLNQHYHRSFTFDDLWAEIWRRNYAFRQRSSRVPKNYLPLDEARTLIAQDAGFGSWVALTHAVATGTPPVPAYAIDTKENRISPRRQLSDKEWDTLISVMKDRRITTLDANGLMTDSVLGRIAELDHVTTLLLGGSRQLTDDGLLHLARMPQLQHLNLNEYPGGRLTDRGLEVLRHLPNLRTFEMTWQRGITDAGVANLRFCDQLERVDLMGSPTGDGAIEALQGKQKLRYFSSGKLVTDDGLPLLHNFPMLKRWQGDNISSSSEEAVSNGAHLLIDGPFTNTGLASLAGLEGVFELDLFWHVTAITSDGFAHLIHLPNISSLGCDGKLSDDIAMRHIAAMPRLRRLRIQESVATDDGFTALSQSRTIEDIWGRECPNFSSRGFIALSKMPVLRGLGIGLKNVDDQSLSALPHFPALRALTPIGVNDDAFRHVGRCEQLERLTCMYCRQTTDIATEYIAGLHLHHYYAGLTQITDRSLEILGRIASLEQVNLYECKGVTDAGLVFLATLPRLREVHLDGLPGVTLEGTKVFPDRVRVKYST